MSSSSASRPSTPPVGSGSDTASSSGSKRPSRRKRLTAGIKNLFSGSPSARSNAVAPASTAALAPPGHVGGLVATQNSTPSGVLVPIAVGLATGTTTMALGGNATGNPTIMVTGVPVLGSQASIINPTTNTTLTSAPVAVAGSQAPINSVTGIASPPTTGNTVTGNSTVITLASPGPSSSPTSSWDMALAKLSPEDQQALDPGNLDKLGILDKVLEATKEKRDICRQKQWKFTWNGKTIVLRDVVDKLLAWINKFKAIGDMVSSFDPAHSALPWAGFKFLLQVAVDDSQKMGAMLVGLETVANIMGRCAIYETLYLGNMTKSVIKFQEAVVELYARILLFLVRAKQYYSKNTGVRIAFSIFNTEQTTFLDDISNQEALVLKTTDLAEAEYKRLAGQVLRDQISGATGTLDKRIIEESKELKGLLEQYTMPIPRMESDLKVLRDGLEDAERTKVLKWLSRVEYAKHHLNACEGRVAGTGEWLLRKKDFLEWQKSSASTILWLRGIPGAGKTKLISKVIDKLLKQQESSGNGEALAYFYCKRDESGPTDPQEVISAIVKQLSFLRAGSPLQKEVVSVYEARERSGFSSGSLRFQEGLELTISLANIYPQTTIIIDALDECDPKKRKMFLKSLKTIAESTASLVKIFVSSRNDDDIVLRLEDVPNLWIEAKDNEGDIGRFVQEEVIRCIEEEELLRGNVTKELREKIIVSLTKGSQGMFLWADLQIKEICSMDVVSDVEAMLGKLPETLENTYLEIYQRILSQKGSSLQLAERALMWVLCSRQQFPPDMLAAMTSLGLIGSGLDASTLLKICHNLLTVDRQLNIVRFAHLSVREFLEKSCFSTVDAHSMASKLCLSYLVNPNNLGAIRTLSPSSHDDVTGYIVSYWPRHVQQCLDQQESPEVPELIIKFLRTCIHDWYRAFIDVCKYNEDLGADARALEFKSLFSLQVASVFGFCEKIKSLWESESLELSAKNNDGSTVLILACERGYHWIIKTLLERGADINAQGGDRLGGALQAAAVQPGNEKVVELLLEEGADVNAQGGKYGNALQAAAMQSGNEKVVELLLERGANVNTEGGYYGYALQAAAGRVGNEKVVELLLDRGADIHAQGGHYWNALQMAVIGSGKESIVELLLKRGADVNNQGGLFGNALQAAASQDGGKKIVELLLDKGADINAQGGYYENALLATVQFGNEKVVEILLERGADVNVQGGQYGNALQAAAIRSRNEKVVKQLLERGANVNAQGGYYGNALQAAASQDENEKVVELLLEGGADVNTQGGYYGTALQAAGIRSGNEKTMELLLGAGAYVNAQGGFYGNALQAAAIQEGNEKVVELLLKEGADVNAQGGEYGSALRAAAEIHGNDRVVELLLGRGADANAQDDRCWNALQVAASMPGNEKVVELLLEGGADVNAQGGYSGSALQEAAGKPGNEKIVELLLKGGADVNTQGGRYGNALQAAACQEGNEKVVELLLKGGADVNAQGGEYGSALQAAAVRSGRRQVVEEKIVELLLERGADVNAQGGFYGNALQAASKFESEKVVKLLLERGADINAQGGHYENALQAAAGGSRGGRKIVELLLEKGVDVNAQGRKALQVARLANNLNTVELLLERGVNYP